MPRKFGLSPGGQGEIELERMGSGKLLSAEGGSQGSRVKARGGDFLSRQFT